jgi:hypothetical protein
MAEEELKPDEDPHTAIEKAHGYKRLLEGIMAREVIGITSAARRLAETESMSHQGIINLVYPLEVIDFSSLAKILFGRRLLGLKALFLIRKGMVKYGMTAEEILQRAVEVRADGRDHFPGGEQRGWEQISVKITTKHIREGIADLLLTWDPERIPKPPEKPSGEAKNSEEVEKALDIIRAEIVSLFGIIRVLEETPDKAEMLVKERIVGAISEIKAEITGILETIISSNPGFAKNSEINGLELHATLLAFAVNIRKRMLKEGVNKTAVLEAIARGKGKSVIALWGDVWAAEFIEEQTVVSELTKLGKLSKAAILALRSACRKNDTTPERILALVIRNRDIEQAKPAKPKYGIVDIINAGVTTYLETEVVKAGEEYPALQDVFLDGKNGAKFDPEKSVRITNYGVLKLGEEIKAGRYDKSVVEILRQVRSLLTQVSRMVNDNVFPIEHAEGKPTFADFSQKHPDITEGQNERIRAALARLAIAADEEHGVVFFAKSELTREDVIYLQGALRQAGIILKRYKFLRKRMAHTCPPYTDQTGYRLEWKFKKRKAAKSALIPAHRLQKL